MRKIYVIAPFLLIMGMVLASPVGATDYNWILDSGEGWVNESTNWQDGLMPLGTNSDVIWVQTGGTLKINGDHEFADQIKQINVGGSSGTGKVVQSGGTLKLYRNLVLGFKSTTSGTSVYEMTGGSMIQAGATTVALGGRGSHGAMYVSGGTSDSDTTLVDHKDGNGLRLGYNSNGYSGGSGLLSLDDFAYFKIGKYIQLGFADGSGANVEGTLTMAGDSYAKIAYVSGTTSYIGRGEGGTGSLDMSENAEALFDTGGRLLVGSAGEADVDGERAVGSISLSGNASFTANNVDLCRGNYARGTLSITGSASYTSGDTLVGYEGDANVAVMTVSTGIESGATGGTADITGQLCIGRTLSTGTVTLSETGSIDVADYVRLGDNGGTATFNLDGGTLACDEIFTEDGDETKGTTTATFNFNGGVLQATAANADLIHADVDYTDQTLNVKADGAIIDSNGFDIGILRPLLEDTASTGGGLTKTGLGTLTLGGANTYTGDTSVELGTLSITGNTMLSDSGDLKITSGAKMDLAFTGDAEEVNALYLGGAIQASGTWGATGSGAANIDDNYFSGTGTIMVAVPEPTSLMLLVGLVGMGLFCRAKG